MGATTALCIVGGCGRRAEVNTRIPRACRPLLRRSIVGDRARSVQPAMMRGRQPLAAATAREIERRRSSVVIVIERAELDHPGEEAREAEVAVGVGSPSADALSECM